MEPENDFASCDDLLPDARDYKAVVDFNANIPSECANVVSVDGSPEIENLLRKIHDVTRKNLLISQASPGDPSSGGASPGEGSPGAVLPETPSSSLAPALAPVLPGTVAHRAASLPPSGETRNNTASLAARSKNTLHSLWSLALYTNAGTQDISHHLQNASLFAEYAYICTITAGNH